MVLEAGTLIKHTGKVFSFPTHLFGPVVNSQAALLLCGQIYF